MDGTLGANELEIEMETPGQQDAPTQSSNPELDLSETLPHMQYRRIFRYHRGAYKPSKPLLLLMLLWCMFCMTLYDSFQILTTDTTTAIQFSAVILFNPENVSLWTMVALFIAYIVQNKLQHQYSLQWLYPLAFVTVVVQAIVILLEYIRLENTPFEEQMKLNSKDSWISFITVMYLIVSTFYIVCVAVARHVFPRLAKKKHFVPQIIKEKNDKSLEEGLALLRMDSTAGSTFTAAGAFLYVGPFSWDKKRFLCKYSGEVNEKGQPDGFGVWSDTNPNGELLEGFWKDGIPVGPFKSREAATGSGFQRMRVGFVTCRVEDIKGIQCVPQVAPMSVGLASAEPCVSGAFFHEHPLMTTEWEVPDLVAGPTMDELVVKMLDGMITLKSGKMADKAPASLQIFADINNGISISGFIPDVSHGTTRNSITITIPEEDMLGSSIVDLEPLTSVPLQSFPDMGRDVSKRDAPGTPQPSNTSETASVGFPSISSTPNSQTSKMRKFQSMKLGITRQIASLKRFNRPKYEPCLITEGWVPHEGSKGSEVLIHIHGYNSACQHGVKNVAQLWSFASFPSHIKPVVFSWPTGALLAYPLAQTKGAENSDVALALREMIISLARAGVRDFHFQTHSMGARMLMHAIPFIEDLFNRPAFGHTEDAELSKEHLALELTPSEFVGSLRMVNVILMNPEYGMHQFAQTRAPILERICDITTVYGDVKDAALMISYMANNVQSKLMNHHRSKSWLPREVTASQPCRCIWKQRDTCLGLHIYDAVDGDGRALQVDMIDCTFLSSNVQGGRHNTFTLNRSVIEDIYDVVVNRRPALYRSNRLEPRGSNVYSFLVAPSHVVAP